MSLTAEAGEINLEWVDCWKLLMIR